VFKNVVLAAAILYFIIHTIYSPLNAAEINKSIPKKDSVLVKTIIGNCKIVESKDDKININVKYSFSEDVYNIDFSENGNSISMNEVCTEYNTGKEAKWLISIPKGTSLSISSATGNITCSGVDAALNIITGIGNIDVQNTLIAGSSTFTTGIGNVNIALAGSSRHDIALTSGTGNAALYYNGNPLQGSFVFSAKNGHGRIISPVKFEKEEVLGEEPNKCDRKTFTAGGKTAPTIQIATGMGLAELIK
jgi:hypothetical protein